MTEALNVGDPLSTALGVGLGLVGGTVWLGLLTLVRPWLSPDDVILGHDRHHLFAGALRVPLREIAELGWAGRRLWIRDRQGRERLGPEVRVRDPVRVLRILRAALPSADQQAAEARARVEALDRLAALRTHPARES